MSDGFVREWLIDWSGGICYKKLPKAQFGHIHINPVWFKLSFNGHSEMDISARFIKYDPTPIQTAHLPVKFGFLVPHWNLGVFGSQVFLRLIPLKYF